MKRKVINIMFILVICLTLGVFAVKTLQENQAPDSDKVRTLESGWYYTQNGKRVEVTLPLNLSADVKSPLILYYDVEDGEFAGETLSIRGAEYRMEITLADEVLFQYEDDEFPRNKQMRAKMYCNVPMPNETKESTLAVTLYNDGTSSEYNLPVVYAGSTKAVIGEEFGEDMFNLIISLAMLIFSLIAIIISFYMKVRKQQSGRMDALASFVFLCSVWAITDSPFVQSALSLHPLVTYVSFYAFSLFGAPMIIFLRDYKGMNEHRILDACTWALYINMIMQAVLNYFWGVPLIDMLWVTHVILLGSAVIILYLLIREYQANKARDIEVVLKAFAMLGFSGVLALFLYWLLEITYYEKIFQLGILFFVVYLLSCVAMEMVKSLEYKAEALVYQRFAEEDKMTGMHNRRAYEAFMEKLTTSEDYIQDAILIFMDLDRLKNVNDEYGHGAGDELIIAAARCIENAFSGIGNCYRIGGDEFCAIITNPVGEEDGWMERLDEEVATYNRTTNYPLSIARGMSRLKTEDGERKSISDWKYEADQKMYENKGWKRVKQNDI